MSADLIVFLVVLALRLGVPLLILRYPLPAIVAALVLDAADQTIFQSFTDLDLSSYQGYDKALDVYYLAIAYIATMRNWRHPVAVTVAFGLWYYRLVGVALFELTEWRPLLLLFPNTFEYFFIFVAIVRLGWDSRRLSARQVIGSAAAIWIFIKLPQEWWIHIAQLDFTDFVREDLFGVETTDSWGTAISNRPLVAIAVVAAVALAAVGLAAVWRRLPPQDHPITVDADRLPTNDEPVDVTDLTWRTSLVEKVVLIGLILTIFGSVIPSSDASIPEVFLGVAVVVVANAAVTGAITERRGGWSSVATAFAASVVVNAMIVFLLVLVLPSNDEESSALASGFFLLLVSLIIALFDRYRPRRPTLTLRDDRADGVQAFSVAGR